MFAFWARAIGVTSELIDRLTKGIIKLVSLSDTHEYFIDVYVRAPCGEKCCWGKGEEPPCGAVPPDGLQPACPAI